MIFLVAGPGFAPGSSGYEPDELLLLYPADMQHSMTFLLDLQ